MSDITPNARTLATAANREPSKKQKTPTKASTSSSSSDESSSKMYHGQCLERQLFRPKLPYPLWDYDWDGKMTPETTLEALSTSEGLHKSYRQGKNRHIFLVRHGQYDSSLRLTALGRKQAELTGKRLAVIARGGLGTMSDKNYARPCKFKTIYVSDMKRAKETAAIIADHLPNDVHQARPDPLLDEALPNPIIPLWPDLANEENLTEIDENHDRIEQAFQKYFYRSTPPPTTTTPKDKKDTDDNDDKMDATSTKDGNNKKEDPEDTGHEFEILVGHGNSIRYFICRAMQLPPEAWFRFYFLNCSISYVVIESNGFVSVRMIGDAGHLSYDETTSGNLFGYHW